MAETNHVDLREQLVQASKALFSSGAMQLSGHGNMSARFDGGTMLLTRGGLGDAFDVLVRRHQRRAWRLAAQCLGDSALAADAAQNAFVALLKTPREIRRTGRRLLGQAPKGKMGP